MNKNSTLIIVFALIFTPILMSHHDGVAEHQNKDRTGAPGSENTCDNPNCHDDGTFSASLSIDVFEVGTTTSITEYIPGETYDVLFTMANANANVFGFQATAVLEDESNAGTFQNPGDDVQLEDVGGRHIIEHSTDSPTNTFMGQWVAPATGSGSVGIYAAGIAANNSGTSAGDGFSGAQVTLTEAATLVDEQELIVNIVAANGNLNVNSSKAGFVQVYDAQGRMIEDSRVETGQNIISMTQQPTGAYILRFQSEAQVITKKFMLN